jgi:hypothetical protein
MTEDQAHMALSKLIDLADQVSRREIRSALRQVHQQRLELTPKVMEKPDLEVWQNLLTGLLA